MGIDFAGLTLDTIQSQYGASPHIRGIVEAFASAIDPNADINLFYKKVFDLDTAEGVGLDVWGLIVGVPRIMRIELSDYFGFNGSYLQPFGQAPFYESDHLGNCYTLSDTAYRRLIYYKALSNISESTAESQNRLLANLFADEVAAGHKLYITPVGVMKIRATFEFLLDSVDYAMFRAYGLLNRGAGVGWEFYQIQPAETFGFDGSGLQPFNQGVFDPYGVIQGDDI